MAPRPLHSAHLKILRGNPGRREIATEVQPDLLPEIPEPPEFLTGHGAAEWRRLAPQLVRLRLLTVADLTMFGVYCEAYQRWRTAAEVLWSTVPDKNKAAKTRAAAMVSKAGLEICKYANQFGFTPASRAAIASRPAGEAAASKFAGLLASQANAAR